MKQNPLGLIIGRWRDGTEERDRGIPCIVPWDSDVLGKHSKKESACSPRDGRGRVYSSLDRELPPLECRSAVHFFPAPTYWSLSCCDLLSAHFHITNSAGFLISLHSSSTQANSLQTQSKTAAMYTCTGGARNTTVSREEKLYSRDHFLPGPAVQHNLGASTRDSSKRLPGA